MYKARHIGKIAEQSGPQLLRADTRHGGNDEKKYRNDICTEFLRSLEDL